MRVTTLQIQQQRESQIMQGQERLAAAQDRVSTGLRISKPSDAPSQIAELLRIQAQISQDTSVRDGIQSSMPTATTAETALGSISNNLRQIKSLAMQANSGAVSADQRAVLASQIHSLVDAIRVSANTNVGGKFVFAGTDVADPPFQAGPPITYTGNNSPLQISVGDNQQFAYSFTGVDIVNSRGGTDLFTNLTDLENAVKSGDTAGMSSAMGELDTDTSNIIRLRADMGSRINFLDHAASQLSDRITLSQQRESDLKDADMAEAILQEKTAEATQQGTLAMASTLNQPSLLDYLR